MTDDDAGRAVHEALGLFLRENEIAVAWTLTIDVAGEGGLRYLAHRAGGGADGSDSPMAWTYLGMVRAAMQAAEDQLRDATEDVGDDD